MSPASGAAASEAPDPDPSLSESEWEVMDGITTRPSSPTKEWRSPGVQSPSTPANKGSVRRGLLGNDSPSTPSRPSRSVPGTSTMISRTLQSVTIDDDDNELPLPKRLFGLGARKVSEDENGLADPGEVHASPSRMNPPPTIPNPRPLQASSTQTSFASTKSADSLFSTFSRTSSTSSLGSFVDPRTSPRKRGSDDQNMSPSKTRKLAQTQQASPHLRLSAAHVEMPSLIDPESALDPGSTFSLAGLFGGEYPSQLDVQVIAHCTEVQKWFDSVGVHLGVQWELTRGVVAKKWTWKDVEDKFKAKRDIFHGTNSELAEKVPAIMRGRQLPEPRNLALWNEIDRENAALLEGKSRGLGLMGRWNRWDGQSDYYGGQIQYPLRLVKSDDDAEGHYQIHLEPPQKGRSHRFARDLGSPSVLQLSIPSQLVRDESEHIKRFLAHRFVLNGRIFVAIPPKDMSSVYLIQINQDWERRPSNWFGDQYRISFEDFIQRHNPPDLNSQQPFAKYTARFALGLSTSTPVLEFEKKNIFYIQDVVARGWDSGTKPPAEKIMTDGCGFINRSGLLLITKTVGYSTLPTAVQGRIGGAKGLWVLHPTDKDPNPKIWIRDSQLKIRLQGDHRVHRIFDLLRASHPSQTEARYELSEQSILCLSSNGIPDDILATLLVEGLEQTVKPLLDWSAGAMPSLWRAVNNAGSVSGSRLQRIAGSKSRVLGFRDRDREESDGEAEAAAVDNDDMTVWTRSGRDSGGAPPSLHERTVELLQAGFTPTGSAHLNDKLRYIIRTEINSVVDKYRISLPESTASDAFVIPDPFGILKENEIYYRSSNPMKNPDTQTLFQTLLGPVILGRYPIRLPCDMQMVTAVDVPELYDWPDVIIVSTAGEQSLLSLLSGGDYDGDTVIFIWLKAFLENFKNQPFTPPPRNFILDNFEREVKTVEEVGKELSLKSPEDSQRAFQEHLLVGLRDTQVGLYSFFHDNAIWRHGYKHRHSILMAYIGNTLLDAGKTGLRLKNEVFEMHRKAFNNPRAKTSNWDGHRDPKLPPFILKKLSEAGKAKGDELLREYDLMSGKLPETQKAIPRDGCLLQPYKMAQSKAGKTFDGSELYRAELAALKCHVDHVKKLHARAQKLYVAKPNSKERKADSAAAVLSMHSKFAEAIPGVVLMDLTVVEELKASYAYTLAEEFGFAVAFRTLCLLKARATPGGVAPNCRLFDELKTVSGAASRATLDDEDF